MRRRGCFCRFLGSWVWEIRRFEDGRLLFRRFGIRRWVEGWVRGRGARGLGIGCGFFVWFFLFFSS